MARRSAAVVAPPAGTARSYPTLAVHAALALALFGSAWLIDPSADAAFDAPKRLVLLVTAAVAGAIVLWREPLPAWRAWTSAARAIAVLMGVAVVASLASALISPHWALAMSAWRAGMLMLLFVPIGASSALEGGGGPRVLRFALIAAGVNFVLSLAQSAGVSLPIPVALIGGRYPTGALLGNEGYVALTAAMAAVACAVIALKARGATRWNAGALVLVAIAVILVNRQMTSAVALIVALAALVAVYFRRLWILGAGVLCVGLLTVTAALTPLRQLTWARLPISTESYQQATTYRLGAWVAAVDMIESRPLAGFGPGTFGAEAQIHRLNAEIALRERLAPRLPALAFVYAHQDYLQLGAEAGLPALIAVLGALGLLLWRLARLAAQGRGTEPLLLLGVLIAGAVLALAWFPLQIPFTAVVLLLACGRAFRLIAEAP